ncbi:MAG: NAD(P)-dependent oxidoreductase [Chloroflexota bacterium]
MSSLIMIHANVDTHWPFVGQFFHETWEQQDETHFKRLLAADGRDLGQTLGGMESEGVDLSAVTRLAVMGVPVTVDCLKMLPALDEATLIRVYMGGHLDEACQAYLEEKGVSVYDHKSEGFWGQSVSEFALGLTICGLRRIPQNHHSIITSHAAWEAYRPVPHGGPGTLGHQFSDDNRFTCGTIEGKRVRVVGAGNIGSRYASFTSMMGADVAAWDPFAPEASFHRAGSRREMHLDELVKDAEIFAPMLPITPNTRGLVTEAHIDALPKGCLVILATRAKICDVDAIRRRVMADEIALAADVFDMEPVPLDDPLLGRHNVVHTPHLAGRTIDANREWVKRLTDQFKPM